MGRLSLSLPGASLPFSSPGAPHFQADSKNTFTPGLPSLTCTERGRLPRICAGDLSALCTHGEAIWMCNLSTGLSSVPIALASSSSLLENSCSSKTSNSKTTLSAVSPASPVAPALRLRRVVPEVRPPYSPEPRLAPSAPPAELTRRSHSSRRRAALCCAGSASRQRAGLRPR